MEMINRCLEITEAKREALEAFDSRQRKLEERALLREQRGPEWGNRKQRRRQVALERKETAR
jgi:hypothetical protein